MACARASCVNARCDGKHEDQAPIDDEVVIIVSSEGVEFEKGPPGELLESEPETIQMPRWFTDAVADAETAEALPSDPVESVTVRPSADFGNVESGSSSRSETVSESEDPEEERRPERGPERKSEQRRGPVRNLLKKAKKAMSKSKKKDPEDSRPKKGKGKFGGKPKKGKK